MFSTAVAVALSVVFLVTAVIGASSLARGARTGLAGGCGDTRTTELLHVVMSVAMIAMVWGLTGGPDTVGGAAQVVVFGLALVTLAIVGARDARRGLRREARSPRLSHGLMAATTVWMVATMPLLMGAGAHMAAADPAAGATAPPVMPGMPGMPGMAGMAGMAHGGHTTTITAPAAGAHTVGWATVASTALVLVLVVVGVAWVVRAFQLGSRAHRALARGADAPLVPAPRRAPDGATVRTLAPVGGAHPAAHGPAPTPEEHSVAVTATPGPFPAGRPAAVAASCHALMSLGMAAMLATML